MKSCKHVFKSETYKRVPRDGVDPIRTGILCCFPDFTKPMVGFMKSCKLISNTENIFSESEIWSKMVPYTGREGRGSHSDYVFVMFHEIEIDERVSGGIYGHPSPVIYTFLNVRLKCLLKIFWKTDALQVYLV